MGLFDKVFSSTETGSSMLSPAEAAATITLVAVASDGYLSDEESQGLWFALSRMQLFKNYSSDVVGRMFDKLAGILRRQGADSLLQLAKASLPYELAPTMFAIATDLVFADGMVTHEEEVFIERLCRLLEVPQDLAQQIVQVILIKNKG